MPATSNPSIRGLQSRVIDGVGRQIIGGEYLPGDLVPREAELTEQFAVSRTSVREGMRVLAAKGLVDIRQKIGTRVRRPEEWNSFDTDVLRWHREVGLGEGIMRDLAEIRLALEPLAARRCAELARGDSHRRIAEALSGIFDKESDSTQRAQADSDLHFAVYAGSGNLLLAQFGGIATNHPCASFGDTQPTSTQGDAHVSLTEAILAGDGETAAVAMLHALGG